jgi:hypothetical protein
MPELQHKAREKNQEQRFNLAIKAMVKKREKIQNKFKSIVE